MVTNNILITHGGGSGAVGVIKSLSSINFTGKVVVTDSDDIWASMKLADVYHKVPKTEDPNFSDKIFEVIENENINLIIPTGDTDLLFFSKNKSHFENLGVTLFMSDYQSMKICLDKLLFYKKCKDKFPLPITSSEYDTDDLPLFAKPKRHTAGSRGIKLLQKISDINSLNQNRYEYIYQEYLPGQEYTIDVLCDMESNPLVSVARKRLQLNEGVSFKGEIVNDKDIDDICFDICKFLNLKGPICLQMKEDVNGLLKFVEINPRIGGSTYFATLAGVNFIDLILKIFNKEQYKINKPKEIKIARFYEEVII